MRVKAHLHLPKRKRGDEACISVAPFAYKKGQGTTYCGTLTLRNVTFKVSQPGRERTLREGQKNVHAWVVGTPVSQETRQFPLKANRRWNFREAKYIPQVAGSFFDSETHEPLHSAQAAYMVGSKVYYLPNEPEDV